MTLEVGQPAPDFTLPTDGGGTLSLKDLRGRKVVLYFYPKDDTSGCTAQACAFRDAKSDFDAIVAVIVGISMYSDQRHDIFNLMEEMTITSDVDTARHVLRVLRTRD